MKSVLLGLDTDELRAVLAGLGEPSYRGSQLAEWIYRRWAREFDDMSSLPVGLRVRLAGKHEVGWPKVVTIQHSRDGTFKLLLELSDGARIESVGLPYRDRFSCCLSTQVGCPIGCLFCASGAGGLVRDLTPGEIAGQFLAVQEAAKDIARTEKTRTGSIDHVTIMGMGEPLLNYASTVKAVRLLNREIGIGMRHITLSTIGFPAGIRRLAGEKLQITLAVSLHAPTDELRRRLIPATARWRIGEIIDACREYIRRTGRRITFEYCMLDGVNDGADEARELGRLLGGLNCHVNLISYNPVAGLPFRPSPRARVRAFRAILQEAGIQVTQRVQRGADIDAACGQLRQRLEKTGRRQSI